MWQCAEKPKDALPFFFNLKYQHIALWATQKLVDKLFLTNSSEYDFELF